MVCFCCTCSCVLKMKNVLVFYNVTRNVIHFVPSFLKETKWHFFFKTLSPRLVIYRGWSPAYLSSLFANSPQFCIVGVTRRSVLLNFPLNLLQISPPWMSMSFRDFLTTLFFNTVPVADKVCGYISFHKGRLRKTVVQ